MRWIAILLLAACGDDGGGGGGGDGGNRDAGNADAGGDAAVGACAPAPTFAAGKTPTRTLHVAANAAAGGDGSSGAPFQNIEQAAAVATPGTAIRLGPGTHVSDQFISMLHGTAAAPIWIGGEPGQPKPIISGGGEALHLSRANYVVVHDLEVTGATANGFNFDDGADYDDATAAQYIAVERVFIHDIGTGGNNDCLKVSGINHLWVYDSHFENCGSGGSGVDHVGCHDAVIANNVFDGAMSTAVQAKGGSRNIEIRANRIRIDGGRAINLGGSTGFEFFRPSLSTSAPNAEARDIRAVANYIYSENTSSAPFAFVGCVDCLVAHNVARGQQRWNLRILQETTSDGTYTFEPASNGRVINNSFVFLAETLSTAVNVGADTDAASFEFRSNLWYASDDPSRSAPTSLPAAEVDGVVGMPSAYGDANIAWDPHGPFARPCTPEHFGADLPEVTGDALGSCFGAPRPIGPLVWESCTL
jgi:hypothetical protein